MKKFFRIMLCLMLCVTTIVLGACKDGKNNDNYVYPSASSVTYSNGGLAVQKGDYVYFVNGFMSVDDSEQDKNYVLGALMVAKLDDEGMPVLDDDGNLTNYTTIYSKLCGYEVADLFIAGDYIYFTTPCQDNESGHNGSWASERVDFDRVKLDNSSKVERLYRSTVACSDLEFKYYDNNGVKLFVYEKDENLDDSNVIDALYIVEGSKSTKIASNVSDVCFGDNDVFYVLDGEDASGNATYTIVHYDVATKSSTNYATYSSSITLQDVCGDYVFIKRTNDFGNTVISRADFSNNSAFTDVVLGSDNYDSLSFSTDGNVIVAITDNEIEFFLRGNSDVSLIKVSDTDDLDLTPIGFDGGSFVYIDSDNVIKKLNIASVLSGKTPNIETIATVDDIDTTYFDLADGYLYFYKTVGSNNYLHFLAVGNNTGASETMLGVYIDDDKPETTDETDE